MTPALQSNSTRASTALDCLSREAITPSNPTHSSGIVNACIPAAEEALKKLLPRHHASRRYKTLLAPYGRIWSYQASKWYLTRRAAELYPGLVKYKTGGEVDSYNEDGSARTIEPHFDTGACATRSAATLCLRSLAPLTDHWTVCALQGNMFFWGLCIIFGRFEGLCVASNLC